MTSNINKTIKTTLSLIMLTSFLGASLVDKEDKLNTTQSSEDEINPTLGSQEDENTPFYKTSLFRVFIKSLGNGVVAGVCWLLFSSGYVRG